MKRVGIVDGTRRTWCVHDAPEQARDIAEAVDRQRLPWSPVQAPADHRCRSHGRVREKLTGWGVEVIDSVEGSWRWWTWSALSAERQRT